MKHKSYEDLIKAKASAHQLSARILHEIDVFNMGTSVNFDFLSRSHVGAYCKALGFAPRRNWAAMTLDEISPESPQGPNLVPEKEAAAILGQLQHVIDTKLLVPMHDKEPQPDVISDFLPKGKTYKRKKTLGHLWEFRYALAVELEHGKTRGANVTNNHPLLTALVVVAHLSEDKLYYARLWHMESAGELFNAQLHHEPLDELLKEHNLAGAYLQARLQECIENTLK